MPHATFELLVLAAKSFIKIKGVNNNHLERNMLKIIFNKLCGVSSLEKIVKETMFERVMRATNVLLNASVSPISTIHRRRRGGGQ